MSGSKPGLGFRVWSLGFGSEGFGFDVYDLEFRVWSLAFRMCVWFNLQASSRHEARPVKILKILKKRVGGYTVYTEPTLYMHVPMAIAWDF